MPLKLSILPRKHNTSDDPKEPHHPPAATEDFLYTHPMPNATSPSPSRNRRPSDSSPYGGPSHHASASVRGSTSTIPSSSGPRTPPPMPVGQENRPNVFEQVVFDRPTPAYKKSASPDDHSVSVFPSPSLPAPSAAAFVATRANFRQDMSMSETMSPSHGGYFGSSPRLQGAQSDEELLSFRAHHSRNDSMGYYYGNGSGGRLETSASSQSLDKMLLKSPEQLAQPVSVLNLSDDDGDESDESFAERNRRSEAELMKKGAEELKRRSTLEALKASGVPSSPEDAKVELPSEVVRYMQKADHEPAPAPGLLTRDKRVMTVSEFEQYRRTQEETPDPNDDDKNDDSDNEGFFKSDSDSDSELQQEQLKMKQRQDANLAIYRQQMRKVTGNSAIRPPPPPPLVPARPNGQSPLSSGSSQPIHDDEDEEDEIPLAILHAHGLPGRHRGTPPIASRPMSSRTASIYPNQSQAQPFPPGPPPVPYPRGLTLPDQMYDPMFDPQFQQPMPTPRGLIHEIAREQEAKLHRRSMLNMHMQTAGQYDGRPVSPLQRGSMSHSPPAPYGYPPVPQMPMPMPPQMQPQMQPVDNSGISPDLQMQMQKFLGLQMQMMQQMLQTGPQLPSPVQDLPRRVPSPANSVRGSTYPAPVPALPANLHSQAPHLLSTGAANPSRYRTLSTQPSLTNLNYHYETNAPSLPDSPSGPYYATRPHEQPSITHRPGSAAGARPTDTIRVVDKKILEPALPIRTSVSTASGDQEDAQEEPYDGGIEDNESREWERLRRQKSTLRKAWKQRRGMSVLSPISAPALASTSETPADS
ncbi:hypothetical protein POJ06DRAFT_258127 [Lipomyces tetrasporus]|uniref:Uncharacterized protein n=1 Tax=Lipomyces tetrasporus TaxID=54092 RepID=A0AAD7QPI2_9ASCO|nr:uncharacterized protein POJ06DRAFT_258127 [Lipomyces tetrasporus]KAJ8098835.1 hypothetical protein POJ06DRAFT_258127 [Lipomyces tetrasporus]